MWKIVNNFWRKENKKQSEFEIFLDDKSLNKKKIANKLPKANQWLGMEVGNTKDNVWKQTINE